MFNDSEIVVVSTYCKNQLNTCIQNTLALLQNTIKPDTIFISLSLIEFPNRFQDLPKELVDIVMTNPSVKINWSLCDNATSMAIEPLFTLSSGNEKVIYVNIPDYIVPNYILNRIGSIAFDPEVIVSLTSFYDRFKNFSLFKQTIDSLVNQDTNVIYKICLTLFKDDITKVSNKLFKYLEDNRIEVISIDEDIKGHKKYYQVMQKYPSLPIITVDDDLIYSKHMVQILWDSYQNNPKYSYCGWVRQITFDKQGNLKPDIYWESAKDIRPSVKNVGFSGSGLLIPPHEFDVKKYHDTIVDGNNLYHDEIILKKMMIDNDIKVCWTPNDIDGGNVWKYCSFITGKVESNSESKGALHKFNNSTTPDGVRNGDIVVKRFLSDIVTQFSLIIPVRNVSKFLDKFDAMMKSVMSQSFKNYEIIVVNDYSDDNTIDVLNKYAKKCDKIRIVNNDYEVGIGNARNKGIEVSRGEYVWILDADDFVLNNKVLENIYGILYWNQEVDILEIKPKMSDNKYFPRNYPHKCFERIFRFRPGEYLVWNLQRNPIIASWGRVYNGEFIRSNKSLRFSNTKFCNDLYFRLQGDALAEKVFLSNGFTAYVYNVNTTTSISSISKKANAFEEYWKIFKDIINVKYVSDDSRISVIGDMYQRMLCVLSTINRCIGHDDYIRCLGIFSNILNKYDLTEFVDMKQFNKNYFWITQKLKENVSEKTT